MNSYITNEERAALITSDLPTTNPFLIGNVSMSMFSIARYSGGIKYNGSDYTYIPTTDELVRKDVVKWLKKYRKGTQKVTKIENFIQVNK
jgi:hypothetical protein